MFFEKFSRFVLRYDVRFGARKTTAPTLPLVASEDAASIHDALVAYLEAGKAIEAQPNGDVVDLIAIEHWEKEKALVLLFQRGSPGAADPTYRRKGKTGFSVRMAKKRTGEEQAASAHLVIRTESNGANIYRAALEEIPGISMSVIQRIIRLALRDYPYTFKDKFGHEEETYPTFKPEGKKSESLTNALKSGRIDSIKLVRTADPALAQADTDFKPVNETMTVRINGSIDSRNWIRKLGHFVEVARGKGWEKCNIDLTLDDSRKRTIQLDRENQAKDILFVRSEQIKVKNELPVCSEKINKELSNICINVINKES